MIGLKFVRRDRRIRARPRGKSEHEDANDLKRPHELILSLLLRSPPHGAERNRRQTIFARQVRLRDILPSETHRDGFGYINLADNNCVAVDFRFRIDELENPHQRSETM